MKTKKDVSVKLSTLLSKEAIVKSFEVWLVGHTPLITHAWAEKSRIEMLTKQVGGTKPGKTPRDPESDFVNSLYKMGEDKFGFPATGIKNCILSAAHKDKGIPRTIVMQALWIDAEMVSVRPALAGAICDVPLVRIYGSEPQMREDMVRVGSGLNKTASLAYRGQFKDWGIRITGKLNESILSLETLAVLIQNAGMAFGLGEWRNEKKGMFGAFHLADAEEENAWDRFAAGKGKLPVTATLAQAA